MDKSLLYTGTQVNYCVVCPRKLWLFSYDFDMEHTSELVEVGRLIHEASLSHLLQKCRISAARALLIGP